jgi:hypothetical protein
MLWKSHSQDQRMHESSQHFHSSISHCNREVIVATVDRRRRWDCNPVFDSVHHAAFNAFPVQVACIASSTAPKGHGEAIESIGASDLPTVAVPYRQQDGTSDNATSRSTVSIKSQGSKVRTSPPRSDHHRKKKHAKLSTLLLRKLDLENKMLVAEAVDLLARAGGVSSIDKRNEREALCAAGLAVFGQEDAGDAAEALEDVAQFLLFGHFGDL